MRTFVDGEFIWCSTNNGVYRCKLVNNRIDLIDEYLIGKPVARVFKDRDNGYWFQTLNDGIYYLPTLEVQYLKTPGIKSMDIDTVLGDIYMAHVDGRIVKGNTNLSFKTIVTQSLPCLKLKYNYYDRSLLLGWSKEYFSFYKNDQLESNREIIAMGVKSFFIDGSTIYRGDGFGLSVIKNNKDYTYRDRANKQMWCSSIMKYGNDIWIGTKEGVRIFKNQKIENPFAKNKYLSSAVVCFGKINNDIILLGTKKYGLLVVKDDSIIDKIGKNEGLLSNEINTIHVDNEQKIWVGNHAGMSSINYIEQGTYTIQNLTKHHGFIAREIRDIKSYKDNIYASSRLGIYKFDKTKISKKFTSDPANITDFYVNYTARTVYDNLNLSYKENNIGIAFLALNYRKFGEIEYKYRMLGIDTNWVTTSTRLVQYPILPPDDYVFEVKAKNEDGFWSEPAVLSFTISPPIWKTWWFITIEALIGILIIFNVISYREKQNNKRVENEKNVIELELKSLRSQMNPHFIFNTLNTIQNAINTLDKKIASNYVADFGRLIRIVLESSKKPIINLDTEIEMLSLYINLEAVRFSNKFAYRLAVDNELANDIYKIPTMVIQPFVENAIIHGLVPKMEDNLNLNIEFKLIEEDTLLCIVEDNGIGRKASNEINKKSNLNKTSMGIEITKERLHLYDRSADKRFEFKVIDLVNGNKPAGTRVEIIFAV